MSFSIEGKTAIVTGAANGIGLAIARHFIAKGAYVMMADKDDEKLQTELDAIEGDGSHARSFSGDLRQKLTIANLLSATIEAYDSVDILVNASRRVEMSDPLDAKTDSFAESYEHNVLANLRLSQAVAKRMIQQGANFEERKELGSIVNLTSIAADRAHAKYMSFATSCAAINQMTRSLAVALAGDRIRVNAISIGSVMSASLLEHVRDNDALREEIKQITPLGRIAETQEVAESAQYLCSPAASFMTGHILTLDGGRTITDPLEAMVY